MIVVYCALWGEVTFVLGLPTKGSGTRKSSTSTLLLRLRLRVVLSAVRSTRSESNGRAIRGNVGSLDVRAVANDWTVPVRAWEQKKAAKQDC